MDVDMESIVCLDDCSGSNSNSSGESEQMISATDLPQFCENMIFIDMRGFRSHFGRFICKEFCLIDSDGRMYHKFIKSPFPAQKLKYIYQVKVEYEEKVGHRIPYDYGNINIIEMITDTYNHFNSNKTILVRDKFDQRNLKYIFRNCCKFGGDDSPIIITLKDLDFNHKAISTQLEVLPYCDFHNMKFGWGSGPCAKNIALQLQHIFAESKRKKEMK